MSNSPLTDYVKISPYRSSPRSRKIDKITIHHMAGNLSVETCGNVFQGSRKASANYGIGTDGRVGMYVEEKDRAWTSSNTANDDRAVTIEVANSSSGGNWPVSDKALAKLIDLCVDICQRNGIRALNFTGDKNGNLTMHKYFAATACPGPYLAGKFSYIAQEVNKRLNAEPEQGNTGEAPSSAILYRVQVGAFSKKANAALKRQILETAGFEGAFMTCGNDNMWRVQVGAFEKKANAEKMQAKLLAAGFSGFITTTGGKTAEKPAAIKAGSTVRVKEGAKTYTGGSLAKFVYGRDHVVRSIVDDRAVITYNGIVVAAMNVADLTLKEA